MMALGNEFRSYYKQNCYKLLKHMLYVDITHVCLSINNLSLGDGMGRTKIYGKLTFSKMVLTMSGTHCTQSGNCMWSVFSLPLATLLFNLNYSSIHIAISHCGLNLYIPGVWLFEQLCTPHFTNTMFEAVFIQTMYPFSYSLCLVRKRIPYVA